MEPVSTSNATKLPIEQDAWLLHSFDNLEVIRIHLPSGLSMEKHINDWNIVFFVLCGRGSVNVEGRIFEMEEKQSIAVEAGKERFWTNPGDETLELLAIKTREKNGRDI